MLGLLNDEGPTRAYERAAILPSMHLASYTGAYAPETSLLSPHASMVRKLCAYMRFENG